MDIKKIGLIALVVVALVAVIWSFRSSFYGGPAPKGEGAEAQAGKARMEKMMQQGGTAAPQPR